MAYAVMILAALNVSVWGTIATYRVPAPEDSPAHRVERTGHCPALMTTKRLLNGMVIIEHYWGSQPDDELTPLRHRFDHCSKRI